MPTNIEDVIKDPRPLDEDDEDLLKYYEGTIYVGVGTDGPYFTSIKKVEKDVKDMAKRIGELFGSKMSHTDLTAPLQVARCTKIINSNTEDAKDEKLAEVLVELGDKVSPNDIKEG